MKTRNATARECGCDEPTLRCLHVDGQEVLRLYDHSVNNFFSYRNGLKPRYSVVGRDFDTFWTDEIEYAESIYDAKRTSIWLLNQYQFDEFIPPTP